MEFFESQTIPFLARFSLCLPHYCCWTSEHSCIVKLDSKFGTSSKGELRRMMAESDVVSGYISEHLRIVELFV